MAPHSSTVAWKIPWMEESGRLQSMGSLRAASLSLFTFMHWRRKWQPTPVFLPGAQSRTRLKRLSSSSIDPLTELPNLESGFSAYSVLYKCHIENIWVSFRGL